MALVLCTELGIIQLKIVLRPCIIHYPYLIYCVEIWGISPQTHLKSLFLLQKKIVRVMTFSTYCAHTGPIFKNLNILTIDYLVIHRIGIMMYKFSNCLLPTVLYSL